MRLEHSSPRGRIDHWNSGASSSTWKVNCSGVGSGEPAA
jgi:hypothetical protein